MRLDDTIKVLGFYKPKILGAEVTHGCHETCVYDCEEKSQGSNQRQHLRINDLLQEGTSSWTLRDCRKDCDVVLATGITVAATWDTIPNRNPHITTHYVRPSVVEGQWKFDLNESVGFRWPFSTHCEGRTETDVPV